MITAYRNISEIASLSSAHQKDGRNLIPTDISSIKEAAIIFNDEKILWVGRESDFPSCQYEITNSYDLENYSITPELVDSHTHLVFGGDRSDEYSMRLNGADYEDIAKAGGGILSTMNGTNSLSRDQLFDLACKRINRINSYGVGTIEIKSGYGLNIDKEYECSHVINDLKKHFSPKIQIKNTFMAAHAVPRNYNSSSHYLDEVVLPLLKKLASEDIIDAVDIFHESGYFDEIDTQKLFDLAKIYDIPVKSHADEFNDNKGAILAVENNALSTDHLLATTEDGIESLASSQTVATLLPGTGLFLGKPQADAQKFFNAGVKVAIASDYNPGSCHCDNLLLIASVAAPIYQMNIAQLWTSITFDAANSLGIFDQGAIVVGLKPRFSIFKTKSINAITYNWGRNFATTLMQ